MKLDDPKSPRSGGSGEEPVLPGETKNDRDLLKIAAVSTSLAFACMTASIQTLRSGPGGFYFHLSKATIPAFVLGAMVPLLVYWAIVAKSAAAARWRTLLWVATGAAAFFYPLRFLPGERLPEIATGLVLAACAISFGVYLLWRLNRYLDRDARQNEKNDR